MKPRSILIPAAISVAVAGPAGGFIFGFMNCSDCGWNIFGRMFVGCVMAVLVPFSGGVPPQNEGGVGPPDNAWPHIIVAALLLFVLLIVREKRKARKSEAIKSATANALDLT